MSRVDVIIPCYNYGRYLADCVQSVLSQEGVAVRALILDDASTDDSAEVAARLAERDGRVEFRRHAENRRHIATYNEGLAWAGADYTLLLSADDFLAPGALRRAAELMDTHPEVGMTYGRQVLFDGEGRPRAVRPTDDGFRQVLGGTAFIERCCEAAHNPVATPTAVVRTALQHAIGGYRKNLPHTADMELWLRFAAHGSVGVIGADQAFKRIHLLNMQHQYVAATLGDLMERRDAFEALFREHGGRIEGADRLLRLARRRLGEEAFWAASKAFDRGDGRACGEMLETAVELFPELPLQPIWSRLRWKRRLGPRLWRVVRPLLERLRRTPPSIPLTSEVLKTSEVNTGRGYPAPTATATR